MLEFKLIILQNQRMLTAKTFTLLLFGSVASVCAQNNATIQPEANTLMHEMRETPSPLSGAVITDRSVSFMWPLDTCYGDEVSSGLDGDNSGPKAKKPSCNRLNYSILISQDSTFRNNVIQAEVIWPFYNSDKNLTDGKWYWKYGYANQGSYRWSELLSFTLKKQKIFFAPPAYGEVIKKVPKNHPRILTFDRDWDGMIEHAKSMPERNWYIERAEKVLTFPIVSLDKAIDTSKVSSLDSEMKKFALLTRESRRVTDKEEANIEVLIRSYMLTKDRKYADAAMARITEIVSWKKLPFFVGDFNHATLLSLSSLAYDSFHSILTDSQKIMLLKEIQINGTEIFEGFVNHLENHIADNHNWQMNLRIFTMAAFAAYGELEEADLWTNYAYNIWLARFPGLNKDGGWHNGDSYFHVNLRTLIEVPYFYSRVTEFDFFQDPWYKGSGMYVIFQQPPFSKSAGNGSSHQTIVRPSGTRVAYADALAKLTQNNYLADYVNVISAAEPDIMKKGFQGKAGDLSWFRIQCKKEYPEIRKGMAGLPLGYVFPQTGIATLVSNWDDFKRMSVLSFRSSPYGSTSHALANQNAFNTFFAGKPLFYSSGHHISFTDEHSVYAHRSTRAHNTILVDGMGQKIGTEGYGWISRSFVGREIAYLSGDASNAYGNVTSPLWLARGKASNLAYSPENGWDENKLKTFRRHIVQLGSANLIFIYDELESTEDVRWDYLLHTTENPMDIRKTDDYTLVKARNANGVSDAYLFTPGELDLKQTDQFFFPAINWLRADDKGYFPPYKNHWHFTASTKEKSKIYRFITIVNTRHKNAKEVIPVRVNEQTLMIGEWTILFNGTMGGKAAFKVENKEKQVRLIYTQDQPTVITEKGKTVEITDKMPELEI